MSDLSKRKPCEFPFEIRGRIEIVRPVDSCSGKCESCAWNPAEQKRRLAQGEFRTGKIVCIYTYADEKDKKGTPVYYTGLRSLHFPPRFRKEKKK